MSLLGRSRSKANGETGDWRVDTASLQSPVSLLLPPCITIARMPVLPLPAPLDPEFVALQTALAGQYSLERELGRGGMGIVYLAREVRLERLVAIKLLPPGLAGRPDLRERFLREARTAARLSHPNIVPIFRVDDIGGVVFIVMA